MTLTGSGDGLISFGRVMPSSNAEGPGLRSVLWVAGCSIRCHDCFNPHLFQSEGFPHAAPEELAMLLMADSRIEGVTFLGGEPFDQAPALAKLAVLLQQEGLSVMTFTGYRLEHLRAGHVRGASDLLEAADLLVDGPFLRDRVDYSRAWIGSTNQRLIALSPRYRDLVERFGKESDRLEVTVALDGSVRINGWADKSTLAQLGQALADQIPEH